MFGRKDLEALAAYQGRHPVVSLYLYLDPRLRTTPGAYEARLRGLLKEAAAAGAPAADIQAIEAFFGQEFDWSGQGVAVFSSSGDGFLKALQFMVPLRSHFHVGHKPFIKSLADLMDTYGSYSVALVDKQSARLFHFHLGELVAQENIAGEDVKRLKAGGGGPGASRTRGDDLSGHGREIVRGNLRRAADGVNAFCARHKSEHLLLGGAEPTLAQFRGMLAPQWQGRLEGSFNIDMHASETEVRDQSLETLQANASKRQAHLVEIIRTAAGKGTNGAAGLEATLSAVHAGRVQTLAIVEGFHAPGYRCEGCGFVTAAKADSCSFCGGTLVEMRDAVEHAIRQVVEQGAGVEFLEAESALSQMGNIGALLRY